MFQKISTRLFYFLLIIIALSVGTFYLLLIGQYLLAGIGLCLLAVYITKTLRFYNSINRKLAYFFESIENDDFSLSFIIKKGTSSEKFLNYMLNKIKRIIQKTRIEAQQQERFYELMLSNINSGIVVLNPKGFVIQCNSAALKLLGVSVFTHTRQLDRVDPSITPVFNNIQPGENRTLSMTLERGRIQLVMKASGITLNNENLRLLVIHDINNEMDEKEIESWIKLIRVLSHEIMNSIAPITSLSDTLLSMYDDESTDNDKIRQNSINGLHVISETSKGLVSFVESYRKFTRIPTPERELFSVNDFVQRIVILSSAEANFNSVKIEVSIEPEELKVFGDSNLLGQVLINIVKNAIQALTKHPSGLINISVKAVNDKTVFIVKDNGPGIPEELIKEIFVPFFTTKEQGSGIGLSLARQIMRAHGGSIQVQSVPGKETRFTIIL